MMLLAEAREGGDEIWRMIREENVHGSEQLRFVILGNFHGNFQSVYFFLKEI